jgi:hypothetical protein
MKIYLSTQQNYKTCQSKCKHTKGKENQNHQNNGNEVEDVMLKRASSATKPTPIKTIIIIVMK